MVIGWELVQGMYLLDFYDANGCSGPGFDYGTQVTKLSQLNMQ